MQISAVRDAIATAARAVVLPVGIPKLTCTGYAPDAVTVPHFYVGDYSVNFDKAMRRSLDEVEFTCAVLVSRSDDLSGQKVLDGLLSGGGTGSLKAAVEAARGAPGQFALGGAAHDLHVMRVQSYRWYEHAGTQYLGAELVIKVIGEGST
ncbi:hypothetical protein NLX86_06675 [Streptomyces sp. A3M-1-3]|uniref:hypothetical protein n=1 Tax=Streptomyces sp. A3M-1-3 TaxID=2962044 RepID=UPI0020B6C0AD|nr:hypothetical protein [Streptomyces sp. A3M-1-3]MCP3817831.1 hypothetical protein [Streptomyces sp. A3M-1-3]